MYFFQLDEKHLVLYVNLLHFKNTELHSEYNELIIQRDENNFMDNTNVSHILHTHSVYFRPRGVKEVKIISKASPVLRHCNESCVFL